LPMSFARKAPQECVRSKFPRLSSMMSNRFLYFKGFASLNFVLRTLCFVLLAEELTRNLVRPGANRNKVQSTKYEGHL